MAKREYITISNPSVSVGSGLNAKDLIVSGRIHNYRYQLAGKRLMKKFANETVVFTTTDGALQYLPTINNVPAHCIAELYSKLTAPHAPMTYPELNLSFEDGVLTMVYVRTHHSD